MTLFGYEAAYENAGQIEHVPWSHAWFTRKQTYNSAAKKALFLAVAIC